MRLSMKDKKRGKPYTFLFVKYKRIKSNFYYRVEGKRLNKKQMPNP